MTTRWDVERAVLASGLPAPSRLIMLTLLTLTESGGTRVPQRFTPSHNRLADLTGLSRRTVIDHLGTLEQATWLTVVRAEVARQRADKAPNQYTLRIPASARAALASAGAALEVVQEVHQPPRSTSAGAAHRSDPITRPTQNQARDHEIEHVIKAIRLRTDREVTPEWAGRVIEHLLGDRVDINNRLGYLLSAIRREPNPHQRFLPTSQPPPFRRDTA